MQMLGNLEAKQNFIFSVPTTCPKHFPAPPTVPIADTLLCYAMHLRQFFFFVSERRETSLRNCCMIVNKKINKIMFLTSPPPQLF